MPEENDNPPVLQLITGLGVGGAERLVVEMSINLARLGRSVMVVALNDNADILAQYSEERPEVKMLGFHSRNIFGVFSGFSLLMKTIEIRRIEVVHAHMFHALLVALACRVLRPNLNIVFTSHSAAGFNFWRRCLIRSTKKFRSADVIFAHGQHTSMNARDSQVIPNGVVVGANPPEQRMIVSGRIIYIFVGRMELAKNPLGLLEAFSKVKNKKSELWMVGDGSLMGDVEQAIDNLSIRERVSLFGVQKDVGDFLQRAHCFVMSSSWEGLPMALLEAGALALPVVAPPVGAIPEILADGCGYLTSVEEMSKALDAVEENYVEARNRGLRLRKKIEASYSLAQTASAHENLYRDVRRIR